MKLTLAFAIICSYNSVGFGSTQVPCLNGKAVSERHTTLWSRTVHKDWMKTVQKWYIPLWSKFYKYRVASEVLGKEINDITPNEVGVNSCLFFAVPNTCFGFRKKVTYAMNGTETSFIFKAPYEKAHVGEYVFELTDNSKFILGVTTWDDGEKGWAVMSNVPRLETSEYERVLGRVKSLGFDLSKTVFEDFSSCEDP